jgi:acetyl esterase/lipase
MARFRRADINERGRFTAVISLRARLLIGLFRLTRAKRTFADVGELERSIRKSQEPGSGGPPRALGRRYDLRCWDVHGFACHTLSPLQGPASSRHVLYLHGGAYVHAIERSHWSFVGRLVDRLGCQVTVARYPLAPGHHYDETLAMVEAAYRRALGEVEPAHRVLMGDSAGGGLCLVLAQRLKAQQQPQPGNLVLISPWLDISVTDGLIPALEGCDPYLSAPGLLAAGQMYTGTLDLRDPKVSPIYGRLDGLGRISVFIGTRDVLLADSRRLRRLASERGVDIDYVEYDGMFHGWVLQRIPEGREALARIVEILQAGQT